MKKIFIFLSIIIYAILTRYAFFGSVPPLAAQSSLTVRFLSGFINLANIILLYLLVKKMHFKSKIALSAMWVFTIVPWSFEQGRVISGVNTVLFISLLTAVIFIFLNNKFLKILLAGLFFPGICYFFPNFWLFRIENFNFTNFLNNLFYLLSGDFLFFNNMTFWWGGVKNSGIIYLSFLPFLLLGFSQIAIQGMRKIIYGIIIILLLSSASPFFPESREFFLALPLISIIIAIGMEKTFKINDYIKGFLMTLIFLFIVYDISQFLHNYFVHYPQWVLSNISRINEPF
jgi:hypothetical protein